MESSDVAVWASLVCNVALSIGLAAHFRRGVASSRLAEASAKAKYSLLCVVAGLLSGLGVFLGVVAFFHLNVGHGEVLFAGPVFNTLLSIPLVVVGRIIIGWEPIRW